MNIQSITLMCSDLLCYTLSLVCKSLRLYCISHLHLNRKLLVLFLISNLTVNPPFILYATWMTDPITLFLHTCHHDFPNWVCFLVPKLSNDIELNPGDY